MTTCCNLRPVASSFTPPKDAGRLQFCSRSSRCWRVCLWCRSCNTCTHGGGRSGVRYRRSCARSSRWIWIWRRSSCEARGGSSGVRCCCCARGGGGPLWRFPCPCRRWRRRRGGVRSLAGRSSCARVCSQRSSTSRRRRHGQREAADPLNARRVEAEEGGAYERVE